MNKKVDLRDVYYLEVLENDRRIFIKENEDYFLPIFTNNGISLFNATKAIKCIKNENCVGKGKVFLVELAIMQFVLDGDKNINDYKFSKKTLKLYDYLNKIKKNNTQPIFMVDGLDKSL